MVIIKYLHNIEQLAVLPVISILFSMVQMVSKIKVINKLKTYLFNSYQIGELAQFVFYDCLKYYA